MRKLKRKVCSTSSIVLDHVCVHCRFHNHVKHGFFVSNLQYCVEYKTSVWLYHRTEDPVSSDRDRKCALGYSEELDVASIWEDSGKVLFMV